VLDCLLDALRIASSSEMAKFVPEVRTNIVMSIKGAKTVLDVAGFPGRLSVVRDRIVAFAGPEFGASKHMAAILLSAHRENPKIRGLTCIRLSKEVERAVLEEGLRAVKAERPEGDRSSKPLVEAIAETKGRLDVLFDPGEVGVEPVAYVFGYDAIDAVRKAIRICRRALSKASKLSTLS